MSGPGVGDVLRLVARMAQAVQAEEAGLSLDPLASDALSADMERLLRTADPAHLRALAAQAEAGAGAGGRELLYRGPTAHHADWVIWREQGEICEASGGQFDHWVTLRLEPAEMLEALGLEPLTLAPAAADAQAQDGAGAGGA